MDKFGLTTIGFRNFVLFYFFSFRPNKAYQLSLVGRTPPVNHQTKLIFSAILFCEKDPTFPDKIPTKRSNVSWSMGWKMNWEELVCYCR
jgi:hypothetical protein